MSAAELEVSNRTELEADLRAGLWSDPATLPPRWFYDERGSRLFDEITALPEYYPTRAEHEILARRSHEIVRLTGARSLHELGAGTATKTRELLDALTAGGRSALYVPLDISEEVLLEVRDLAGGVHPGIRPPRDDELRLPTEDAGDRGLQGALHRPQLRLTRPPAETGAVIGEIQAQPHAPSVASCPPAGRQARLPTGPGSRAPGVRPTARRRPRRAWAGSPRRATP